MTLIPHSASMCQSEVVIELQLKSVDTLLIKAISIDIAKYMSNIHGVNIYDLSELNKNNKQYKLLAKIARLSPNNNGMHAQAQIIMAIA